MFLGSTADIAFYGGAAGGGKSYALLVDQLRWCIGPSSSSDFRGLLLRKTIPDLTKGGGLWDTAASIYRACGGHRRQNPHRDYTFASGAQVAFGHLTHDADLLSYQGQQYSVIGIDEVTHFSEVSFWGLYQRIRSASGAMDGYMRCTLNPDAASWVKGMISWWLDVEGRYARDDRAGIVRWMIRNSDTGAIVWGDSPEHLAGLQPQAFLDRVTGDAVKDLRTCCTSVTFIPARLEDNTTMMLGDPRYRARLSMGTRVQRARMLDGDWLIQHGDGTVFRAEWFPVVDNVTESDVVDRIRCWDLAGGSKREGDRVAGARVALMTDGSMIIEDMVIERVAVIDVKALIVTTANQDTVQMRQRKGTVTTRQWFEQERGSAGALLIAEYQKALRNHLVDGATPSGNKQTRFELGAQIARDGRVSMLRAPWNDALIGEAVSVPDGTHDDAIDAVCYAITHHAGGASEVYVGRV